MERKVGEIFEVPYIGKVKCVPATCCDGCVFDSRICKKTYKDDNAGYCGSLLRSDGQRVQFIKVD